MIRRWGPLAGFRGRGEIIGASNFLEVASALFHANAETKLSALHRKMIIRVVKIMGAAFHHSQLQSGNCGPGNCFAVAGMDLRDIQSGKVA
ncbi:hypothetical protein [Rhizobium leguminosarum]|uniref:hypothetical protein n=1 Tax=Rhizobium leguminosarum TaxID=384 RepID=UPI0012F6EE9E|nr:hypothetical protein [Rhizobium leguminosarum]